MFLKHAIEFLDRAKRHAEDGDVRGALELTHGALEWLKIAERRCPYIFPRIHRDEPAQQCGFSKGHAGPHQSPEGMEGA